MQSEHLTSAWVFRKLRHSTEDIAAAENALELNEGLAEYTGVALGGRPEEELRPYFVKRLTAFQKSPSYLRTFAYECIPVYGYFLAQTDPHWHKEIDLETHLTEFFSRRLSLKLPEDLKVYAEKKQVTYGFPHIWAQEETREKEILAKIKAYKGLFIENTPLILPLENMNLSFDYRDIMPLEDYGTVYPSIRITDNWGVLSVQKGALINPEWNQVRVSEPLEITDSIAKGEGWTLELTAGNSLEKKEGSYTLH